MKKSRIAISMLTTLPFTVFAAQHQHDHISVDYSGKPATPVTAAHNAEVAKGLNFNDKTAFDRFSRNQIAEFDQVTADILRAEFSFISEQLPDSVNPSLYRQAQLNMVPNGLYKVTDGIYQIRGTDLSNMTLIRGETGWIVYDVLLTKEAAEQSLKFAFEHLPEGNNLPIVAMIYSHSHADHFGGARGVQNLYPDVKVYGSNNITAEIVDENVLAGNAMSRRASYQYGVTLGKNNHGIIDAALAKGLSKGEITYVKPDYEINQQGPWETLVIDGLEMVFMDVSGTEAASEMVTYIPSKKALSSAELTYDGMHNIYTLRGAKVRDALKWSKNINQMISSFGQDVEVLFASHSAPVWGNEQVNTYLKMQRDNYGLVHNQSLRLANQGIVLQDIGDAIMDTIPQEVKQTWYTNGYHGTYSHNAKAVYNMYLGYFDMNPANLNPLPTKKESLKFVEYMGGANKVVEKAQADFNQGDYRFVATVLNKVVMAEPSHQQARDLLADAYEQLGYQAEGAGWRNIYLTGAQELRVGIQPGAPKSASADVLGEMDVATLFDFLAVKVDSIAAAKLGNVSLNVVTKTKQGDVETTIFVELSHGNLNNIVVDSPQPADATLTIAKTDMVNMLLGKTSLKQLLQQGKANMTGDKQAFGKIASTLVQFNDQFEIVPLN
tara:strand:- start:18 stop:2009 length:1992 start_codon:yes stop_codon:yes gene_type:complete